jgi:hypothetical protein
MLASGATGHAHRSIIAVLKASLEIGDYEYATKVINDPLKRFAVKLDHGVQELTNARLGAQDIDKNQSYD